MQVEHAQIEWREKQPFSPLFNDVYFSKSGGLEESKHVFLTPNQLPARFKSQSKDHLETFVIGETGFGTGLNFFTALQSWSQSPEPRKNLDFISFERFPLSKSDFEQAYQDRAEFHVFTKQLLAQYPHATEGPHIIEFEKGRVRLILVLGDIVEQLPKMSFFADAWFLDGFKPSHNSDMWSENVLEEVSLRSKLSTSFGTFTAAGFIQRSLIEKGFAVNTVKGFGHKREMLTGTFKKQQSGHGLASTLPTWTRKPEEAIVSTPSRSSQVVVIGAGLAGICTAIQLKKKGLQVSIVDRQQEACQGGSRQPRLIMYAKFPKIENKELRWIVSALNYSQSFFCNLNTISENLVFEQKGLLQLEDECALPYSLPKTLRERVDKSKARNISRLDLNESAWWYPHNGAINPSTLSALLTTYGIDIRKNFEVTELQQTKDKTWLINAADGRSIESKQVVVCNAYAAVKLKQLNTIPIGVARGQSSLHLSKELPSSQCAVTGKGYLYPIDEHQTLYGATYKLKNDNVQISEEEHLENVRKLESWLPEAKNYDLRQATKLSPGLRCTVKDYTPIVGPVPDMKKMESEFSPLRKNAKACKDMRGIYLEGLFINIGHGSKGASTTPICGEIIASQIAEQISPIAADIETMLSPARFLIKELIQNKR